MSEKSIITGKGQEKKTPVQKDKNGEMRLPCAGAGGSGVTSTPEKPTIVSQILDAIAALQPETQLATFKDANDEFYFHVPPRKFGPDGI